MERNITLDYFKLFLSILVVTIHLPIVITDSQFIMGGFILTINKIAVPCFFILNGFFLSEKIKNNISILKYLKKLLILILTWNLIYIYYVPMPLLNISQKIAILFLGSFHLWYLSALFGAIIVLYVLVKKFSIGWKTLLTLSFIFLALGYYIEFINFSKDKMSFFDPYLYRNFIFFGFPFVSIGYLLSKYKEALSLFHVKYIIIISLFLIFLFFGEVILLKNKELFFDFYLSLFFLCPILFLFVSKYSKVVVTDGFIGNLSQAIYFIHPLCITLVINVFSLNYFNGISSLMLLPIILFFTSIVSVGIIQINKRIRIFL